MTQAMALWSRCCRIRYPLARLKFPAPATTETRVTGQDGDPVFMVAAEPSGSLAGEYASLTTCMWAPSPVSSTAPARRPPDHARHSEGLGGCLHDAGPPVSSWPGHGRSSTSHIDIGQPDLAGLRVARDAESTETASGLVNGYPLAAGQAAPVEAERALTQDQ